MIRAVVKNGILQPLDPLPPEWSEGQTIELSGNIEATIDQEDLAQWYHELEDMVAEDPMTPDEVREFEATLAEADGLAKDQVRREMGLP